MASLGWAGSGVAYGQSTTSSPVTDQGLLEVSNAGQRYYYVEAPGGGDRRLMFTTPARIFNSVSNNSNETEPVPKLRPGGRQFAVIYPSGFGLEAGLYIGTAGGRPHLVNKSVQGDAWFWSPDGRDLAVLTLDPKSNPNTNDDQTDALDIVRADGSGVKMIVSNGVDDGAGGLAWSPNGDQIALWGERPPAERAEPTTLEIINLVDGSVRKLAVVAENLGLGGIAWTRSGDLITSVDDSTSDEAAPNYFLQEIPAAGGILQTLAQEKVSPDGVIALSPDGDQLAIDSGTVLAFLHLNGRVLSYRKAAGATLAVWTPTRPAPESTFDRHWSS
jgi:hypothetical protein